MTEEYHTLRGYQLMEQENNSLTHAMEDYLEMICRLSAQDGYTRVNILADKLNVQAPSVTKMVQRLAEAGLLAYQRYGIIHLTEQGQKLGRFLMERHQVVENFLANLGLAEALKDTEKIEHSLSDTALERLKWFNEYMTKNPQVREQLLIYIGEKANA